jgi:ubiquinol-cytochrome c reductase cytochrome b subunit
MKQYFSGLLIASIFVATTSTSSVAGSRAQRDHGAQVFNANGCLHCHTMGNTGGTRGPNLSGIGRTAKPEEMRKQIVQGGKGMPAFGEVLQPNELDDLIAYLRSCKANPKK